MATKDEVNEARKRRAEILEQYRKVGFHHSRLDGARFGRTCASEGEKPSRLKIGFTPQMKTEIARLRLLEGGLLAPARIREPVGARGRAFPATTLTSHQA